MGKAACCTVQADCLAFLVGSPALPKSRQEVGGHGTDESNRQEVEGQGSCMIEG